MNVGKVLDEILKFLIDNPERININAYTIQKTILNNSVSLLDAKELFQVLAETKYVKVYGERYLGKSIFTDEFLSGGGFQKLMPNVEAKSRIIASDSSITIFLSYCWKQRDDANDIFKDLSSTGITIKKDDHELDYKDSIHDYMQSIRDSSFALVLISDDFLKSQNCMNEMVHLFKEKDAWDKILPILIEGTTIFRPKDRAKYIKYWEEELANLQEEIANLPPYKSLSLHSDVKLVAEISMMIDSFLSALVKTKNIYLGDLKNSGYEELHKKIGVENLTYAFDLLKISYLTDVEERELALTEYAAKYPINSFYWSIMAATAKMSQRFIIAKEYYLKSIELAPDSIAALNNLGMLYLEHFRDYAAAEDCFNKVLAIDDMFTISRLNLGVTYGRNNEQEKAFKEYQYILTYDPLNAKAHCNIGNYYRNEGQDTAKAEEHYKIALESDPNLADTYLTYGNFLKSTGRLEQGNDLYRRLLQFDIRDDIREVVEMLLTSNKG
jgi:Tfp pilus assembly protein PilF